MLTYRHGRQTKSSLLAIPSRMHRISSDLRSEAAQGPVSTRVGDGLGTPSGAVSFCSLLFQHPVLVNQHAHTFLYIHRCLFAFANLYLFIFVHVQFLSDRLCVFIDLYICLFIITQTYIFICMFMFVYV